MKLHQRSKLSLKSKRRNSTPWDLTIEDRDYQKEPWILKKNKNYITIERNNNNKGNFYIQKDNERRLSLSEVEARSTYSKLIGFGYKAKKISKSNR